MLRLLLPPNLAAAAARNAIAVKAEIAFTSVPPPHLLPALALLQQWGGRNQSPFFLQLRRSQLCDLIDALRGQPVFGWIQQPDTVIAWDEDRLTGVSEHLEEPSVPPPPSMPANSAVKKQPAASSVGAPMTVDGSEHFLAITLPGREHPRYAQALDLLKSSSFTLETSNRKWWLRDRHKTLNFLAEYGARLREEFGAQFTENFRKNTGHLRPAEIVGEALEANGGFTVALSLKAGQADESQLRAALATHRGYVEAGGHVYLLEAEKLNRFAQAQRALTGEPEPLPRRTLSISATRVAEVQTIIEELAPNFQPPAAWRARSEALRNLRSLEPAPIPSALAEQLRPYQKLGAAWLWHLHRHQLGGILADEMGLGKTPQALALLAAINASRPASSAGSLVVCPASLLENWRRETTRFTPQLRVCVHHGEHRLAAASLAAHDLIITSYGTLTRDQALFQTVEFACIVADEAQHVKNRRSQNAAALRALRARSRFMLTGTPLENSLDDLRALFEFLMPGFLDKLPAGLRADERSWHDGRLRARTGPYILRRTKAAVAPELPPKLEQTVWCEFTPDQAALYREVQQKSERELFDLEANGASDARLRLAALTQLLRLRQLCCDPRLIAPVSAADSSAKLEAFRELLAEALDDNHRILVFSQFTSLLALLRSELDAQGIVYCYLDGSMPTRARQAQVDRFQASTDVPVFLLSLKAGGAGLNLASADTVVHFDPWWNPAAEAQATDRAHRIGQIRTVTSYKLICSGTVEEKVLALQQEKRALLAGVFEASAESAGKLSLSELKSLLQ